MLEAGIEAVQDLGEAEAEFLEEEHELEPVNHTVH
jgi:hypothetical protein